MKKLPLVLLAAISLVGCEASKTTTESGDSPDAPNAMQAQFLAKVDGLNAESTATALENVSVYLTPYVEPGPDHQPTFGHDAPIGEPNSRTNADGIAIVGLNDEQKYVVRFVAAGYDDVYRVIEQAQGTQRHIHITMNPQQSQIITIPTTGQLEVNLGNTNGGTVEPVTLLIEPEDLGLDNGAGDAAAGDVEVRYQSWDPAVDEPTSMPSDLITNDGPLTSLGMFRVEFFQGGDRLNVRPGQTIGWRMKVNEQLQGMAAATAEAGHLNIYSLDTSTGEWVEDTDVQKTYDAVAGIMETEASHFSTKNLDFPPPFPGRACADVAVVNQFGEPRPASVSIDGRGPGNLGCNQVACDFNNAAGSDFGWRITASADVAGVWHTETKNAVSECDDETGGVGCGLGQCADVTFTLCNPQDGACNGRVDCCTGLGCFAGECDICREVGETCATTDECCGATTACLDFVCRTR
ncbi:MAG: hypothetical protein CMH52_03470 [Myxococcales bacterium]|nr:hypothetical protein [Myxococcales bacterium]